MHATAACASWEPAQGSARGVQLRQCRLEGAPQASLQTMSRMARWRCRGAGPNESVWPPLRQQCAIVRSRWMIEPSEMARLSGHATRRVLPAACALLLLLLFASVSGGLGAPTGPRAGQADAGGSATLPAAVAAGRWVCPASGGGGAAPPAGVVCCTSLCCMPMPSAEAHWPPIWLLQP